MQFSSCRDYKHSTAAWLLINDNSSDENTTLAQLVLLSERCVATEGRLRVLCELLIINYKLWTRATPLVANPTLMKFQLACHVAEEEVTGGACSINQADLSKS